MPLLANVIISTNRSQYTAPTIAGTSGVTSAPYSYLTGVFAHIEPTGPKAYAMFGDAAIATDYMVTVDTGTDIVEGDRLSSITLIDGITPWPGSIPYAARNNEYWGVTKAKEIAPMLLPACMALIKRVKGGGPGTT